jgi:hypothetical protein
LLYQLFPDVPQGVPIEEIEYKFRSHWAWGKLMAQHDAREESKVLDEIKNDLEPHRDTLCKVDIARKGKPEI